MTEDFIPQSFASLVLEGLSPSSKKVIAKIKKRRDPMLDLARPTAVGIQPFGPRGAALSGTAGTSGVTGLHNQGW